MISAAKQTIKGMQILSSIEKFTKKLAKDVYYDIGDTDHPQCPVCGAKMTFHGGALEYGDGYWDCPDCDFTFTEDDLSRYD